MKRALLRDAEAKRQQVLAAREARKEKERARRARARERECDALAKLKRQEEQQITAMMLHVGAMDVSREVRMGGALLLGDLYKDTTQHAELAARGAAFFRDERARIERERSAPVQPARKTRARAGKGDGPEPQGGDGGEGSGGGEEAQPMPCAA